MPEKIYTIPVNEAFEASRDDASCGCPFCTLYNTLEENELDRILGAAMMEPDVRIETNAQGFCDTHFKMMFVRKNRLGLGLILESHIAEIAKGQKNKVTGLLLDDRVNYISPADYQEGSDLDQLVKCIIHQMQLQHTLILKQRQQRQRESKKNSN